MCSYTAYWADLVYNRLLPRIGRDFQDIPPKKATCRFWNPAFHAAGLISLKDYTHIGEENN